MLFRTFDNRKLSRRVAARVSVELGDLCLQGKIGGSDTCRIGEIGGLYVNTESIHHPRLYIIFLL